MRATSLSRKTVVVTVITAVLYVISATYYYYHYEKRPHIHSTAPTESDDMGHRFLEPVFISKPLPPRIPARKANATFIMLVRDKDLYGALRTIQQIEDRFNRNHEYPYVFLNDKPFSSNFMDKMRTVSRAQMTFGTVPKEHWGHPEWISQEKAAEARERMRNVIYGSSESYRHMCRYQSGLIAQHEHLLQYDFYWRIEPDVKYSCDLDFDPFLFMQDNNKKYAFTISLYEYEETVVGLWNATKEYMEKNRDLLAKDNAMELISDDGGQTYNNCHFWSNFEIMDARWMRGEAFQKFFRHLDQAGGFYYERWGDAPVHTIAAALLLPMKEIHFFREIGYFHQPFYNCPAEPQLQAKCHCDPDLNANRERYSCTAKFVEMTGEKQMLYPEEVEDYYDSVG